MWNLRPQKIVGLSKDRLSDIPMILSLYMHCHLQNWCPIFWNLYSSNFTGYEQCFSYFFHILIRLDAVWLWVHKNVCCVQCSAYSRGGGGVGAPYIRETLFRFTACCKFGSLPCIFGVSQHVTERFPFVTDKWVKCYCELILGLASLPTVRSVGLKVNVKHVHDPGKKLHRGSGRFRPRNANKSTWKLP